MASASGRTRIDIKSNANQVLAATREHGRLLPVALTSSLVNIALAAVEQAEKTGIVKGHENPEGKKGSWYAMPVPGAVDMTSRPTRFDLQNGQAKFQYTRNAKGHILSRTAVRTGDQSQRYLFRDKVVSRTGEFFDDMNFDASPGVRNMQLDPGKLRADYLLESNLGGLQIAAQGNQVLIRSTSSTEGIKMALLEKRGINNGQGRPRYLLRRGLRSVTNRYSTFMRKALAKIEAQAKAKAGLK